MDNKKIEELFFTQVKALTSRTLSDVVRPSSVDLFGFEVLE
jgi:hypothetical protein